MSFRNINKEKVAAVKHINNLITCLVNIKDETGEFLLPLADGRIIDTKGWEDWEWTHGVGLYGLLKFNEITGDQRALDIALAWFKDRFEIGTTKQLWDDTLMMSVLPLAKIGLVLNRPHYIEEAKRQFLQDLETGLWFHGWTFDGRHHFSRARWGRGNCWVTVAIPDFIEMLNLPQTDAVRLFLTTSLVAQIDALVKYQDQESGLWHTLIDDPTSYLEASATAGFAYGIAKALRLRYIPKEEKYVNAAKKAMEGVLANISETGELLQTSFGTPVFDDPHRAPENVHYASRAI